MGIFFTCNLCLSFNHRIKNKRIIINRVLKRKASYDGVTIIATTYNHAFFKMSSSVIIKIDKGNTLELKKVKFNNFSYLSQNNFLFPGSFKDNIIFFEKEIASIRTSRANPSILDNILVDSYGNNTPLVQLGSINVLDSNMITIQVWDASMIQPIEKAIKGSNLGINPQTDGQIIRLPIPKLSEERREELAKVVSQYGEQAKIAIRKIRLLKIWQTNFMSKLLQSCFHSGSHNSHQFFILKPIWWCDYHDVIYLLLKSNPLITIYITSNLCFLCILKITGPASTFII